jgi:hypothetical protein
MEYSHVIIHVLEVSFVCLKNYTIDIKGNVTDMW